MLSSSATYEQALARPHRRHTIIDVVDALGNVRAREVPFEDGSVSASVASRVTRRATLRLAEDWFPDTEDDAFAPERAVLRISSGIEYANGLTETFPIFEGRVQDPVLNSDGSVTINADDRAADVVAFRFESPRRVTRPTIVAQWEDLIQEAVPGAAFGPHDVDDAPAPELTWDEDRGQAADDLAAALGARWYQVGGGAFVLRALAYDDGTPVATIRDGVGGLLSSATIRRSRTAAANSITVVSERFDGGQPVRVTARDTVPGSPTQYGDLFGRVTQVTKIQTPLTSSEAHRLARAELNAARALTQQWNVQMTPDHRLEPGDTVRLLSRGRTAVQVIDTITYPLGLGAMTLMTRAFNTPPTTLTI